jgi:hypothetical protein
LTIINGAKNVDPDDEDISQVRYGGIVVYEENGHGLVAASSDIGEYTFGRWVNSELSWDDAKKGCEELVLNGFSDWRLPTKEELDALYWNLFKKGIGGLDYAFYWADEYNADKAWSKYFGNGIIAKGHEWGETTKSIKFNVRAVRIF